LCYQANLLGALAFALGETERAGLLWQELLSNSGREADPGELVRARMNLALVHARDNRLEQADQELEKAAGQARELHFETALAEVLVNRAHLEFLQGRVEPAGQHLDQAARLCELTEERSLLLPVLYAGADLDYRRGRLDRAISGLQRLDEQGRLQNRPGARCEARALGLLIDSDLGLLPDLPDERAFIRDCLALDERELLLEWLLVAASLGRAPEDSTLAGLDSLGGSCPRRGLLELLGRGHSGPEEVLSALGQLPPGEWPLGDRLLLNLAEGQAPESCGSLVEHLLQTDRLSPFQQVHLGLLIGRAKLQQGRLAQAGEQLGQAVKVLRGLADSRVLKDTGRYREAPVTQALAQWAQRCQRMIRESPH
jgi:tetratricopeptide (TPR) repeat protein